jgi:hypothetical protein
MVIRLETWISESLPLKDNFPKRLSHKTPELKQIITEYREFMDPVASKNNFIQSAGVSRA